MADSFVLRNGGDFVLRNGGDKILRNPDVVVVVPDGGGSGGTLKKSVGHQLTDLGPRPHTIQNGESTAQILSKAVNISKAKLVLKVQAESKYTYTGSYFTGASISRLLIPHKAESSSKLYLKTQAESWGMLHPSAFMERVLKKTTAVGKAVKALSYISMIESLDSLYPQSSVLTFSFNEKQHNEQLIAFTHTSSWIGNVRYDTEAKTMSITMNGKRFTHCGVERIDYDKFEGAPSKGEHWWREIKDRFNC